MSSGRKKQPRGARGGAKKSARKGVGREDDKALWQAFTQNIDPLDLKGRVPDTETPLIDEMLRREAGRTDRAAPPSRGVTGAEAGPWTSADSGQRTPGDARPGAAAPGPGAIDANEVRRIGKGRSGIDARIDLHGMRQLEAHAALRVFLFQSVAKGCRMVLVITGKGSGDHLPDHMSDRFGAFINEGALGRGVLKRSVPLWLAEPDLRGIVVGYTPAHIRHGGDGALYVQLRRRK